MKAADGFTLKSIADTFVLVPLGSNVVSFRSIVSLSESGAFLWKQLETEKTEDELVAALTKEYDIDEQTARADIQEFVANMKKANLIV